MVAFNYTARARDGRKVDGTLDAADKRTALIELERKGLVPVSVREGAGAKAAKPKPERAKKKPVKKAVAAPESSDDAASKPKKAFRLERGDPLSRKLKLRDMLMLTRDIANLVRSGMTLGAALKTLSRREANPVEQAIVTSLFEEISQGANLSDALEKHPSFPTFYKSMVRAGEASGRLTESLDELVTYYERTLEAREKIVGALIYPCIIMVFGFLTVVISMVVVVPRFETIFNDLGGRLPASTKMMISLSDMMVRYGWFMVGAVVVAVVLFKRYIRTPSGEFRWHGFLLRIPVLSKVIAANAFANFSRTLGGLLSNGVPVLKSLDIAGETVGNAVIADEVARAKERVTDGSTIAKPLSQGTIFPTLFTDMLAVGEEAGDTAGSLGHISRRYEDDLGRAIKVFTTVLEPILMLGVAIVVGFVIMSIMMAVFSMASALRA